MVTLERREKRERGGTRIISRPLFFARSELIRGSDESKHCSFHLRKRGMSSSADFEIVSQMSFCNPRISLSIIAATSIDYPSCLRNRVSASDRITVPQMARPMNQISLARKRDRNHARGLADRVGRPASLTGSFTMTGGEPRGPPVRSRLARAVLTGSFPWSIRVGTPASSGRDCARSPAGGE